MAPSPHRLRRPLGYLLLGLLAYGVLLAATLPAERALAYLDLPPGVSWARAEGSVWAGVLHQAAVRGGAPFRLGWRLHPWTLALGRLDATARLAAPGLAAAGRGAWHLPTGTLVLRGVEAQGAAAGLGEILGLPVGLGGELTLDVTNLRLSAAEPPSGRGRLDWHGAGVATEPRLGLGDVHGELDGSRVRIVGRGGQVDVDGEIQLTAGPAYRLNLVLAPTAGADPGTVGLLRALAGAPRDGRYVLRHEAAL